MEYLKKFLLERNLDKPDGRPLYEYKISNERYQELKSILNSTWRNHLGFEACFVLYAVEFLRAEIIELELLLLPINIV